ncbi:Monocarboxylate transporter 12, partial [Stegodyphus mimosarum]
MEEVKSLLGGAKEGKANGIPVSEERSKSIENGTEKSGIHVKAHSSQRDERTSVCVPDEHVISPNGELDTDDEAVAFISSNKHAVVLQSSSSNAQKYGKLQFLESEYDPHINIQQVHGPSKKNLASERHPNLHLSASESEKNPNFKRKFRSLTEPLRAAGEILKNPMFLIIATNYCIFFLSYMTYLIVIVDYSLDLGVDRTDSVFLVSTFSIADLCGRLGSGWITDSGILKRKHLMMGNMLAVGGLLITTSFTTTYSAVTAVSAITGLLVGINLIIFYALLEEYLGLKQLPMAIGLMNFSIGVVSLITPVLTGYFRDTMGSYDHLFHFLGSAAVLCGLLWFLEPIYRTCTKNSDAKQQEPS